jgi:alkylation response protein AidB-like acyl-CoA dehydrogenase
MAYFRFEPGALPETAPALRRDIRAFLGDHVPGWSPEDRAQSWIRFDRGFSEALGAAGFVGMTWPRRYGGGERSALERYVVLEELLAAGAPLGAHGIGDRQSGPLLLRVGTDAQKEKFLPAIAEGRCAFCIGMSEPDSGSDLASIRSRAVKADGGWRLTGTKVWTTNAHLCDVMIGLFRTGTDEAKHAGLSQFLIDLASPGISIRPIVDLTGEGHFNEVTFEDVFVPDAMLVGQEGAGWAQVTSELAFERSGPDRYLSAFPVLAEAIQTVAAEETVSAEQAAKAGRAVADLLVLRQMSLSVAGQLDRGEAPDREAALVKDLGVDFEQATPDLVRALADPSPAPADDDTLGRMVAYLTKVAPSFSLRGGTREIMRGIVAKGLGLR